MPKTRSRSRSRAFQCRPSERSRCRRSNAGNVTAIVLVAGRNVGDDNRSSERLWRRVSARIAAPVRERLPCAVAWRRKRRYGRRVDKCDGDDFGAEGAPIRAALPPGGARSISDCSRNLSGVRALRELGCAAISCRRFTRGAPCADKRRRYRSRHRLKKRRPRGRCGRHCSSFAGGLSITVAFFRRRSPPDTSVRAVPVLEAAHLDAGTGSPAPPQRGTRLSCDLVNTCFDTGSEAVAR